MIPFDTSKYTKTRAPVVDEFTYEATDPETKAAIRVDLSADFLRKTAETMNRRDASGNPCPIVIGHTIKGAPEKDQPPKVGYLHNYAVEPYEGKPTLWADHYIVNEATVPLNGVPMKLSAAEIAERFPRRSGEIWLGTYEVDPHSLLGATTPHRNLGLLKLSADGKAGYTYSSPGELHVDKPPADKPDVTKTGEFAEMTALLKQAVAMIGQLSETLHSALSPQEPQPGAGGGEGGGGGDSIDEFMKTLEAEGGGEKEGGGEGAGEKEEKPKKKEKEEQGEDAEKVKLQRELQDAQVKLARVQITSRITAAGGDAKDEQLISDLICQPEDVRERMLLRLERAPRALPTGFGNSALDLAARDATAANGKRITTDADKQLVAKLARNENMTFEMAAKKLGYVLPG